MASLHVEAYSMDIAVQNHIIGTYSDYRDYLKAELERRMSQNPQYSLRSFARHLTVLPQNLSGVLKKKKGISVETAAQVALKLELKPRECSYFMDLVSLVHARSEGTRRIAQYRLAQYEQEVPYRIIQEDVFKIISEWYHYAILELTHTHGFKSDAEWITRRLGITRVQAEQAIERLLRLELLENSAGRFRKTDVTLTTTHDLPSVALRKFAAQALGKAIDALETQTIQERDMTTMTMAIDPNRLPEAKEMIKDFRRKLTEFLEQGNRSEVYIFIPSLFRLTKKDKEKAI